MSGTTWLVSALGMKGMWMDLVCFLPEAHVFKDPFSAGGAPFLNRGNAFLPAPSTSHFAVAFWSVFLLDFLTTPGTLRREVMNKQNLLLSWQCKSSWCQR